MQLTKNDFGSVWLCKNCSFRFGFGFRKLTAVSAFPVWFITLFVVRYVSTLLSAFQFTILSLFWGKGRERG